METAPPFEALLLKKQGEINVEDQRMKLRAKTVEKLILI